MTTMAESAAPVKPWTIAWWSLGVALASWVTFPVSVAIGMVAQFIPIVNLIPYLLPFAVVVILLILTLRIVKQGSPWATVIGFLGVAGATAFAIVYVGVLAEGLTSIG